MINADLDHIVEEEKSEQVLSQKNSQDGEGDLENSHNLSNEDIKEVEILDNIFRVVKILNRIPRLKIEIKSKRLLKKILWKERKKEIRKII